MELLSKENIKISRINLHKTYLPDGDIDLTVFGIDQTLPETFIAEILQILESEKNDAFAKFRVKEVQLVKAEVKIIKCLIENFVIDISFNQLSGLSALCFFEEVDNLIGQNHVFKRSIILVKAWCFHESRLLGSNSGLFSTYALKVLVLYIFNLYGNGFAGPLEVLFRFLEFYSKFDWKNYCLSLSGPVPLASLPDMIAELPRNDCQRHDLLLPEMFLSACEFCYGNMPRSQENNKKHFVPKYINIIDPLRADNNLGRSINKASFFRIKSAISLGAERMGRLLDCTDEFLIAEFDSFFKNTWNRHGNGYWIHVNIYNLYIRNRRFGRPICQESEYEQAQASHMSSAIYQKPDNRLKESNQMFSTSDACVVSQTQSSSAESAPIYSEAPNQHCNVFVSEGESGTVHFSSSLSDNSIGTSSRYEVLDNLNIKNSSKSQQCFEQTSWDLRSEDAVKSKNASNIVLHKEEHGVGNMAESSRSGYLEKVKGVKSNNNEAMRPQEEEHHFVSTTESCKSVKYLDALLGVKKTDASFSPPPQQNMSYSVDEVQFPELQQFPTVKRSINVGKHSVDPPSVMNPAESCKYTPASDSTSETNPSSLPPETTQPENVHGQSTVSRDIFRHESTTSESVTLNVHALQPLRVSGSSVLQFPFTYDDISNVEASHYLLNQCFDILYGDFESYWTNLKYGMYCVNGQTHEPFMYFPPAVELPMDFQAQYYWNMRASDSVSIPPTFAFYSHIDDINQHLSFWLPGSSGGIGTFIPNPHTYHQRHCDYELYNRHQNANNIFERRGNSNFNSRGSSPIFDDRQPRNLNSNSRERFSSHGQNHYKRNEKPEGKKETSHQGEGSSSAVNELENLENDSKDNSPYQP